MTLSGNGPAALLPICSLYINVSLGCIFVYSIGLVLHNDCLKFCLESTFKQWGGAGGGGGSVGEGLHYELHYV